MFPITAFFQAVLFVGALIMMERGLLSRFASIVMFIFELTLDGVPQVVWTENAGVVRSQTLFLPLSVSTLMGTVWVILAYIAVANMFWYMGRDLIGRKKVPQVIQPIPLPQQRS